MNSREKILGAIKNNKPERVEAPSEIPLSATADRETLLNSFISVLQGIGGEAIIAESYEEIKSDLQKRIPEGAYVANTIPSLGSVNGEINIMSKADMLEKVEYSFLPGSLAVAENGAIWIDEKQMVNRLLPFICQRLALVIQADDIVANMHEAYERINIAKEGFGVFIAGPSKTADIEQSLVIGAHGARSLVVFILKNHQL